MAAVVAHAVDHVTNMALGAESAKAPSDAIARAGAALSSRNVEKQDELA